VVEATTIKLPEEIFDPDKLYLTKAQIIRIGDKLIARWKKNETANYKMIIITKAAQFLVKRYKDKEIETYYRHFWRESFEIMQENARAGDPALKILKQVRDAPQKQEKQ
jgi:hypothetical protein